MPGAGVTRVGVLALQGGFAAHVALFARLGLAAREVRRPAALEALDALVIPGGESTTLLRLLEYEPSWWEALPAFHARGGAILGTCAGLILLAREVRGPRQRSLGFLDVVVARNAYGRQVDSFEATGRLEPGGEALPLVFIRAPRITALGPGVRPLVSRSGEPVAVIEGRVIGAAFHPELAGSTALHEALVAVSAPSAPPALDPAATTPSRAVRESTA